MARSVLRGFLPESMGCLKLHTPMLGMGLLCAFRGADSCPGHNPLCANSSPFGTARDVVGPLPYVSGAGARTPALKTLPSVTRVAGPPLAQL